MNFIKKVFSPLILIISLCLFFYVVFKSEIYWDGLKHNYYLKYYIITLVLIFFSIITFFINYKIKEYLIISFLSITFSIYTFEGYLTFKDLLSKSLISKETIYEKKTRKKYDKRSRLEIYEDLIKKNNKIKIEVAPSNYLEKNFKIFPLSGIANSKTLYCNENGYYAIYQSDRHGFNNPDKEWDNNKIEYLLVGDSFAHGACVNRPDDIASVLRNLSNRSVLTLGYASNSALTEYASLREYLDQNVKNVLWFYYEGNDLSNLQYELNNKILKKYLTDLNFTQNLKFRQKEIDNLANNLLQDQLKLERENKFKIEEQKKYIKSFRFKFFKFLKIYKTRLSFMKQPKPQKEFKKILMLTQKLTLKKNSNLFFIYLPEYLRYNSKYDNSSYISVKKVVNELNIPFIDIVEEFKKADNPKKYYPFKLMGHYNERGYKEVANIIYEHTSN